MFAIQCDHRRNYLLFSLRCKAKAVKYLLHHPVYGYGQEVELLCAEHFDTHVEWAGRVCDTARKHGNPLVLSAVVKDAGSI